jgi:hypothetical protein
MRILAAPNLLLGLLLSLSSLSCEDKPEYIPPKAQTVAMPAVTQEVNLPTRLWEEIESVYVPTLYDKAAVENEDNSKAKLEIPKEFFTFHVYLKEKTNGILNNSDGYDLTVSGTGGLIDFQQFVKDKKGSFYLGMRPDLQISDSDNFKVFYLSNAKNMNLGTETVGAGCDKYMDISDYFRKKMKKEGIFLTTAEGRHVSLMAGTYFFATSLKGKLYLSQLTIRDSRFKKHHCTWK